MERQETPHSSVYSSPRAVVAIGPADRSEQLVLIQSHLQVVGVAAAMRVMRHLAAEVHVLPQALREFRREAGLEWATVRLDVVERGGHAVAMLDVHSSSSWAMPFPPAPPTVPNHASGR